jgi:Tol biopolymer transport system component
VLLDADTGAKTEVWQEETPGAVYSYPTMSPDGKWIAFRRTDAEGDSLVKVRVDGLAMEVLAGTDDSFTFGGEDYVTPSWSPDGSTIVYLSMPHVDDMGLHELSIRAVDAGGGNPRSVISIGECYCLNLWPGVTWSPDGTQLAVNGPLADTNTFALYVMDPDGANLHQVASGGRGAPAWQPIP